MITCPNCKSDNIVMEQPSWVHTDNPKDEYIEVASNCIDCDTDFTTKHKIGRVLKTYDIETNKPYPYSA